MRDYYCSECLDAPFKKLKDTLENALVLGHNEAHAIYRIIEHQWISRDDNEAMAVANKISTFVREHPKATT